MEPTIHFILRTDRARQRDGAAPLYIWVAFSRNSVYPKSLKKYIPLRSDCKHFTADQIQELSSQERYRLYPWDPGKEQALKGCGDMAHINEFLDEEKVRVREILRKLKQEGALSKTAFAQVYDPSTKISEAPALTFLDYFTKEIDARSATLASETRRTYKSIVTKLDAYRPGIELKDITFKFLSEYENYLLCKSEQGGKGNSKRTVESNMKVIRTLILIAINNGDLKQENYPFKKFRIKAVPSHLTTRDFLEPDEVLRLEKLIEKYVAPDGPVESITSEQWIERRANDILTPGEYKALRTYLLACYTGLRFKDMMILNYDEHFKSRYVLDSGSNTKVLRHYIEIDMHKTGIPVLVPIIDKAMKLLNPKGKEKICHKITNQKINKHLTEIRKMAKIEKHITFHVARHTFATIAFEYGLEPKFVQAVLGHQNKKFTDLYTHLSGKKMFLEMEKMNQGYRNMDQQNGTNDNAANLLSKIQNLDDEKMQQLLQLIGD